MTLVNCRYNRRSKQLINRKTLAIVHSDADKKVTKTVSPRTLRSFIPTEKFENAYLEFFQLHNQKTFKMKIA